MTSSTNGESRADRTEGPAPKPDWPTLVAAAVRAPSSHNSQPWRFVARRDSIELHADLDRRIPVVDPQDRELTISCGAALENLCIALTQSRLAHRVDIEPAADSTLIAEVTVTGECPAPTGTDAALFAAIPERHTHRVAYDVLPLPRGLVTEMRTAAYDRGVAFDVIEDVGAIDQFITMTMRADREQSSRAAFREELADWLRPNTARTGDGMPGAAHGLSDWTSYVAPFVVRTFDMGRGRAARDHDLVAASPLIAVIASYTDDKPGWIAAGRALERVALTVTAAGHSMSYLNQAIEEPHTRSELKLLLQHEVFPQIVLRVGRGPGRAVQTPRRPVDDVLERVVDDTDSSAESP